MSGIVLVEISQGGGAAPFRAVNFYAPQDSSTFFLEIFTAEG